jgi:type II pantothenate kinase
MRAAIDFGISNTDVVVDTGEGLTITTQPTLSDAPDEAVVAALLRRCGVELGSLDALAVVGGRSFGLGEALGRCRVIKVNEATAIGLGGQLRVKCADLLVVSAGSGTATVVARGTHYAHGIGSAVGGGTLLGLSRLILGTADPLAIDALALAGDANGADLALCDVINAPVGALPSNATAVNFGRVARGALQVRREDLAAALVTMVGQVIGTIAVNAARVEGLSRLVVVGRLVALASVRRAIEETATLYSMDLLIPQDPGPVTALGALHYINLEKQV